MLAFVSMDVLEDFHPPELIKSKHGKLAIIQALMPESSHDIEIKVQGTGRSVRTAATRALMNLLGKPNLRRRQLKNLQIELSVFNLNEVKNSKSDGLPD
jgi:hypothetical protein